MKRLQISSVADVTFGVHRDRSVDDLDHPFVCVLGPNESGKSTLAEFLQWTIGGTSGRAASAERFILSDDSRQVGGRLLGELDGAALEIAARFKILKTGSPNDGRSALLDGVDLDAAAISRVFGGLVPEDYLQIHRIRGAELVQMGEADGFSMLLTSFALGSAGSELNPRARLGELQTRLRAADQLARALQRQERELRSELAAAAQRPADLDEIETRISHLGVRRRELTARIVDLQREQAFVDRVRPILPARAARANALAELERLGSISDAWREVARVSGDIAAAHAEVESARSDVDHAERLFEDARVLVGLPAEILIGTELSIADRGELLDAAQDCDRQSQALADATAARDALSRTIEERDHEIRVAAAGLGFVSDPGTALLGRENSLRTLLTDVGIWLNAESSASAAESVVTAREAEIEVLTSHAGPAPTRSSGRFTPGVIVLIVGLLLAALSSLLSPLVPVPVALLTLLIAFLVPTTTAGSVTADEALEDARRALAEAVRQATADRGAAESRGDEVRRALDALEAPAIPELDLARTHVEQLAALAAMVTTQDSERARLADVTSDLARTEERATAAAARLSELLERRGLASSPPAGQFTEWLGRYESALRCAAQLTADAARLRRLEDARDVLVAPVAEQLLDSSWPQRLTRIDEMHRLLTEIESHETRRAEADLVLKTLEDEDDRIDELLEEYPDEMALRSFHDELQQQIAGLEEERDRSTADVRELEIERENLTDTELLAGLLERHESLAEEIADAIRSRTVLERSVDILTEVIDRFEVENQAPAVRRTQDMLQEVVPDWGDIVLRRSTDGKVLLERRRGSTRLIDTRLSDGARSLMYFAMRLAFAADDTERRGVALPILCDDPLVHLDDTRRPGAIGLLADASRTNQVLLFTCDDATVALARDNGAHVVHL